MIVGGLLKPYGVYPQAALVLVYLLYNYETN